MTVDAPYISIDPWAERDARERLLPRFEARQAARRAKAALHAMFAGEAVGDADEGEGGADEMARQRPEHRR
ncbi:MAG: hypothetical protein ACYCU7_18775 [Acidimicrobiales bacterium]